MYIGTDSQVLVRVQDINTGYNSLRIIGWNAGFYNAFDSLFDYIKTYRPSNGSKYLRIENTSNGDIAVSVSTIEI